MSTVSEIVAAAVTLPLEQQREVLARLAVKVRDRETPPLTQPRVAGLHRGMVWMADDFNDPLPDECWLGEEDFSGKQTAPEEGPRVSGLGKGKWQVADDFDAPLFGGSGDEKKS